MDDEQLSLEIIGSPVPLDNSVRFAARGLKNPKDWNYTWLVLGHGNVDVAHPVYRDAIRECRCGLEASM